MTEGCSLEQTCVLARRLRVRRPTTTDDLTGCRCSETREGRQLLPVHPLTMQLDCFRGIQHGGASPGGLPLLLLLLPPAGGGSASSSSPPGRQWQPPACCAAAHAVLAAAKQLVQQRGPVEQGSGPAAARQQLPADVAKGGGGEGGGLASSCGGSWLLRQATTALAGLKQQPTLDAPAVAPRYKPSAAPTTSLCRPAGHADQAAAGQPQALQPQAGLGWQHHG
jgi:hypothetical protein